MHFYETLEEWDLLSRLTKMGCFVQGEKSVWDLLSIPSNQCGMLCPPWQNSVGSFVHPAKNGMGAFVRGIFCPAPILATQPFTFKIDLAFNFEMKDTVQIDARENAKS